jgi:hypothetical protein
MTRFNKLFFIFLLVFQTFVCNSATIKGYLNDAQSGEPVVGAIISLHATIYGAISGLDGTYAIHNIPAGSYQLEITCPSFKVYMQNIVINDSQTIIINHLLTPSSSMLTEVEIKRKLGNGSDQQAINIEKNSDNILNIISARSIELLPDITIANVLQRVSGVTVQRDNTGEARYAIIRGIDKRYNYTSVNGIIIPSPDDKMRYVPMDIFPAEIVDRIEVIKSLTPNMEGDAVGGVVNLVMKNAPDHFIVYASAATGYNQTLFDRSYQGFPQSAINLLDPLEMQGANYIANVSDFQRRTVDISNSNAPANGLFSFTIGNRFFNNKKLGAIFSGSYQNTFKGSNSIFFLPSIQPGENNTPVITDLQLRKYSTQDTRTGLHTKIDYEFNKKNYLSLYALYLQLNELQTRNITDTSVQTDRTGAGTGQVDYSTRAAFSKQVIKNITLQGKHFITDNFKIDYSLVYSVAEKDVPDMTELQTTANAYLDTNGNSVASQQRLVSLDKSWESTIDKDRSAYLNITYTPYIFGKGVVFMTGGMYRNKQRSNYYNDYTLVPSTINQPFDNIYNAGMTVQQPGGDVNNDLDYSITENIAAAYAQAKTTFNKLQILAGLRVENTRQNYSMNVDPDLVAGQNAVYRYTDVLPGLHLKYALSDKENLRFSYFTSIARPGFFELVPYHFNGEYYTETGNDSLNHTVAQNLDLRYEWFPKGIDQLLVGAFYKNISNPIEYLLSTVPGKVSMGELTPTNVPGKPAVNYGAEVVLTKYFHYWGVSANYTYTNSSITTTQLSRLRDSSGNLYNSAVSVTRPLQGQSAHIANLALIYKNPTLGIDAHLSWVYTGRRIAFLSAFEGLDYWQKATSFFDFSCEKRIARHLSLYAKVNNILNTPVIIELLQPKNQFITGSYQLPYQTLPNSTLVEKDYYGQNYLIGLRYKFD